MNCEIYVSKRPYSQPGQCASKRAVRRVVVRDMTVRACVAHRAVLERGQAFELARGRR